jgi:hypothetical protein
VNIAGCLIHELFSASKLTKTEELRNTGQIPKVVCFLQEFILIVFEQWKGNLS